MRALLSVSILLVAAGGALAAPKPPPPRAAAPEPCKPAPPADDLPPAADRACSAGDAPTDARLRAELGGDCGRLHRRVVQAAGREWEGDLDPAKGRLIGPLEKEPVERRVLSLWNQDRDGRAACERSPHIALCDARERSAWLAGLLKADGLLVDRARALFAWYLQAHKTCEAAAATPGADGLKALENDRRRFSGDLRRLLEATKDADRLSALHADYGSTALDPGTLKAWDAALGAWTTALRRRPASKKPAPAKPKKAMADTAPPD